MPVEMILQNVFAHSLAQVSGSAIASSMGVDNLFLDDIGAFWRSESLERSVLCLDFNLAGNVPITAAAMALIGHSFYNGAAEYRLILSNDYASIPSNWFERVLPNAIAASTNATGAVTDVDEGYPADGSWMTPTTGTDWDVTFDFATPTSAPETGAKNQCFVGIVKAASAPTKPIAVPTVKAELYESGSLVLDLGTKIITSTTGQILFWSWDAAELATASGANAQIKLTFAGTGYGGTAINYPAGNLGSIYWDCERGGNGITPVSGGDLGWTTFQDFAGSGLELYPESEGRVRTLWIDFGAERSFKRAYLMLRYDGSPPDLDVTTEWPPTPNAYVDIGVVSCGQVWWGAKGRDFGTLVGAEDASSKQFTDGGARMGSRRWVRRFLPVPLSWLTPTEAHTLFDRLVWRQGILKPIALRVSSDATEGKHLTMFASLRNQETVMEATTTRNYSRAMQLEFIEEL